MASMMRKEHQRAEELEQRKEVERWEQSQQYQDQLERQLMEQVSLRPSPYCKTESTFSL